jgi:hypothetical protein
VDIRHGSNDASVTHHDEDALEAIRRQLDMEYPHSADTPAATGAQSADDLAATASAPRRRIRATTVLGLVVACAGGGAVAVLVTALYETLTPPAVVRESPPATPAAMPHLVTAAAPRPAATLPPPLHVDINTKPASRQRAIPSAVEPVPDVIRVKAPAPSIPTPVATSPPVEDVASKAPAPPVDRPVTARPAVRVVQVASERVRATWDVVKEGVVRPSGALAPGPRSRPEAP